MKIQKLHSMDGRTVAKDLSSQKAFYICQLTRQCEYEGPADQCLGSHTCVLACLVTNLTGTNIFLVVHEFFLKLHYLSHNS